MLLTNFLMSLWRKTAVYEDSIRIFKMKSFSAALFDVGFSLCVSVWFVPVSYVGLFIGFRD
jgi:hypothetical protein